MKEIESIFIYRVWLSWSVLLLRKWNRTVRARKTQRYKINPTFFPSLFLLQSKKVKVGIRAIKGQGGFGNGLISIWKFSQKVFEQTAEKISETGANNGIELSGETFPSFCFLPSLAHAEKWKWIARRFRDPFNFGQRPLSRFGSDLSISNFKGCKKQENKKNEEREERKQTFLTPRFQISNSIFIRALWLTDGTKVSDFKPRASRKAQFRPMLSEIFQSSTLWIGAKSWI